MAAIDKINGSYLSIEELTERYNLKGGKAAPTLKEGQRSFAEVLTEKQGDAHGLKFSKHAAQRLSDRNIELSNSQLTRLSDGMERAEKKGINDSLVMIDNLAFIVNTPSSTVVTAIDANESDNKVFSNIDGAVIA